MMIQLCWQEYHQLVHVSSGAISPVAWPYQEVIYHATKLFLGGLHGDPLAGSQPEQLEAGGGKTLTILVPQL